MVKRYLNWKSFFFLIALAIVGSTIYYTRYLARKIEAEERQRVAEWVAANKALQSATESDAVALANMVLRNNEDMPLIATDSLDNIIDYHNIDTAQLRLDPDYLYTVLKKIKNENPPIEWEIGTDSPETYFVYYGNTLLQREVQYYPIVQLILVSLFIILLIALLTTQNRSTQNQVWAGMAKETAHQMGTPLTSLQGWIEVLRDQAMQPDIVNEIEKDVNRLKLVSERFGKIGSTPQLEESDLTELITNMVEYMKRRASGKVKFEVKLPPEPIRLALSPTLFDWVLENLLKNALDAMEGTGTITIQMEDANTNVFIDIADTGKGMNATQMHQVFKPGYTTKKRGWGLGLTLSKRIVEQYHKGQLFVKQSETNKGTTFRISLPR